MKTSQSMILKQLHEIDLMSLYADSEHPDDMNVQNFISCMLVIQHSAYSA